MMQPKVLAKDLKGVQLYAARPPFMQLDSAPFIVCYISLFLRAVQHLISGTW